MTNPIDVLAQAIASDDGGKFEIHVGKVTNANPLTISIGGGSGISGTGVKKLGWQFGVQTWTIGEPILCLVKGNEVVILGQVMQI